VSALSALGVLFASVVVSCLFFVFCRRTGDKVSGEEESAREKPKTLANCGASGDGELDISQQPFAVNPEDELSSAPEPKVEAEAPDRGGSAALGEESILELPGDAPGEGGTATLEEDELVVRKPPEREAAGLEFPGDAPDESGTAALDEDERIVRKRGRNQVQQGGAAQSASALPGSDAGLNGAEAEVVSAVPAAPRKRVRRRAHPAGSGSAESGARNDDERASRDRQLRAGGILEGGGSGSSLSHASESQPAGFVTGDPDRRSAGKHPREGNPSEGAGESPTILAEHEGEDSANPDPRVVPKAKRVDLPRRSPLADPERPARDDAILPRRRVADPFEGGSPQSTGEDDDPRGAPEGASLRNRGRDNAVRPRKAVVPRQNGVGHLNQDDFDPEPTRERDDGSMMCEGNEECAEDAAI
jgi:hypothetical protein